MDNGYQFESNENLTVTNSSGQGPSTRLPAELEGWNWGAFLLTWICGIGNKVWIALLALIPVPVLASIAIGIVLGLKGNEWAWQNKKWKNIEHFRHSQRIWLYWGIAALAAPFVLILGLLMIAAGLLGYYGIIKF